MKSVRAATRFAIAAAAGLLAMALLSGPPAHAVPGYDALTADQLEQYARARQRGYRHDDAVDYAQRPFPKSVDELSPEQRADYDFVRGYGGLNHDDAFKWATDPPLPPRETPDSREEELAAAEAARQRAADLRGTTTPAGADGSGGCGYDVPGVLATLDALSQAGNTQAHQQLWNALPPDVQRQVTNLQGVRDAAEAEWFGTLGIDPEDQGFVWAAESAALLNTAAQSGTVAVSFVQRGQDYYGPIIADLEARQQTIGSELAAAQESTRTLAQNVREYRATEWFGDISEWWNPNQALADAVGRVASLTNDYALVTAELENVRREAASYASVAPLADIRADAQARAAEEERRFQEAFAASQAVRQLNAETMTGQLAFADARANLQARIDSAIAEGDDPVAEQLQSDLGYLQLVESGWLSMQGSRTNAVQRDLDNLLARNGTEAIGPKDGRDLVDGMIVRGLEPTLDPVALQNVQARIDKLAASAGDNRASPLGWNDVLVTFSDSLDEAFVMPWELVYDPVGSIGGNLRFWRRYGSFWYGVGNAAVDGVIDIVILSKESLDTQLELLQWNFNATLGTDIDWFGNENLQFIGNLSNLSGDQVSQLLSDVSRSVTRRIEMNAASGETGIRNTLSDTGYVVGTVAGAEEGLIRAVVITTKYGKVLVKGKAVEEMLDKAADAAKVADGTVLDDVVLTMPDPQYDPFRLDDIPSKSQIPRTIEPGRIPGPAVGPPRLINEPGGAVRILRTGEADPLLENLIVKFGDFRIDLGPAEFIGKGSTSRAYRHPDPRYRDTTAIKITTASGYNGLILDNYGYRLLQDGIQSGAIDSSKLHVPTVHRQIPIEGGGTLTVVELGPQTVGNIRLANGGQLSPAMIKAVQDGVEELARNRIVFPDFKLDNIGLIDLGNGQYRMSILDSGSLMLAGSADAARRFYSDVLNPPPAAIAAVESIPASTYMDMVNEIGGRLPPAVVGRARVLIANALQSNPSFFVRPSFGTGDAADLAARAFNWTRIDGFKTWLAGQHDVQLDFGHLNAGTGLNLDTLGPGGLTYNPAAARQSLELRDAFGASPGPSAIGSSDSSLPFRLGSDVSGSSGAPMGYLPGWHSPPLGTKAAPGGVDSSSFMAYLPYRWTRDPLNDIELKPFIQRRIVFGATRLFGAGCDLPAAITFTAPASQQAALRERVAALPGVTFIENDVARTEQILDDPLYEATGPTGQDALRQVGLTDAVLAEIAARSSERDVVVAVIDTGVAWGHRDLDARSLWINPRERPGNAFDDDGNGYVDDIVGWNFIDDNNLPWDSDGHGTMVAGIIAAATGNGVGIAGIEPHARIMVLRALDGQGRGRASHTAAAIVYAVDNGARIINLSLGGRDLTRAELLAVEFAHRNDVLVVAAAGNDGVDLDGWGPASARNVLVVGAVGADDRPAATNWGRRLDLVAPGVDVVSLRAPGTDLMAKFDGSTPLAHVVGQDGAYYRASGTSFAAPIVTGVAAAIARRDPARTAADVRRMLIQSARDVGTPGTDLTTGVGRLDAAAALTADPGFFVDAAIAGVRVTRTEGRQSLTVLGAADADRFAGATVAIGAGDAPQSWETVATLQQPVSGVLATVPAAAFAGSPKWTVRLVVRHAGGRGREARFELALR